MLLRILTLALAFGAAVAQANWKLGIWWEIGPGRDSAQAVKFAQDLTRHFDAHLRRGGGRGAELARLVLVPAGRLPLAGRDAQEHPDLRDSSVDMEWGVPFNKPIPEEKTVEATWLQALGCPDPSTFAIGWDLFRVKEAGKALVGSPEFPLVKGLWTRYPSWQLVDTAVDSFCVRMIQADTSNSGPRLARDGLVMNHLLKVMPDSIEIQVVDGMGKPVPAVLEIWRARANPLRPYAALFEGDRDSLPTNPQGRVRVSHQDWFGGGMVHGKSGSNLHALLRARGAGRKTNWLWLDARDVVLASGRFSLSLPAGLSSAWRLAAKSYPNEELLAVESDSQSVWVGMSLRESADLVLRLSEPGGRELFRSSTLALVPGAWEKRLPVILVPGGGYELRMDTPTSRRLVRFVAGSGVTAR
ncbi:MAG: hypothetical protein RL318_1537 [Fibrobacterota bacterium]|jgi:hypothetical protein